MNEIQSYTIEGGSVTWSWESMWALACDDHRLWIKAGYDLDYITWIEREVQAFRDAYKLVQQTIDQWDAIYRLSHDLYAEQLITEADFIAETQTIERSIHPDMHAFPPDALPDCLTQIKKEGQQLALEFSLAIWNPPVTWT